MFSLQILIGANHYFSFHFSPFQTAIELHIFDTLEILLCSFSFLVVHALITEVCNICWVSVGDKKKKKIKQLTGNEERSKAELE